jgi:SCY1-like protein 2
MAALEVFKQVGKIADSDFIALEVLPILWTFSLGPLLNLQQFQAFMELIKSLSNRVEQEQTRKLEELKATSATAASRSDFMSFGGIGSGNMTTSDENGDFESLVLGKKGTVNDAFDAGWDATSTSSSAVLPSRPSNPRSTSQQQPAKFSWSTPSPTSPPHNGGLAPSLPTSRAITPDHNLSSFAAMTPTAATNGTSSFNQPLQPARQGMGIGVLSPTTSSINGFSAQSNSTNSSKSIDWSAASTSASNTSNIWASQNHNQAATLNGSAFSIPPPPASPYSGFSIAPPPAVNASQSRQNTLPPLGANQMSMGQRMGNASSLSLQQQPQQQAKPPSGAGLDRYESLL